MMQSALAPRDRRALKALGIALAIAGLWLGQGTLRGLGGSGTSLESLEQRYLLAKQVSALRPAEEDYATELRRVIGTVESRMLRSATPALAQAEIRSLVTGLLRAEGVDSPRSEFGGAPRDDGHYEAVALDLEFTCRIEQLVDFMAAMANARPILATRTIEITSPGSAAGQVQVRLSLEGYLRARTRPSTAEAVSP
jgi:hypothetical protein